MLFFYFKGPDGDGDNTTVDDGDDSDLEDDSLLDDSESDSDQDDDGQDFRGAVTDWMEGDESRLEFPAALTPLDRRAIHQVAEELGLRHRSAGTGERRRVIIERPLLNPVNPEPMDVDQGNQPNQEIIPPAPIIVAPRPFRERRAPARLSDYVLNN